MWGWNRYLFLIVLNFIIIFFLSKNGFVGYMVKGNILYLFEDEIKLIISN